MASKNTFYLSFGWRITLVMLLLCLSIIPLSYAQGNTQVVTGAPPQVVQQQDFITLIITSPFIWITITAAIIMFGLVKLRGKPVRPETKPFYGRIVRKQVTKESINKRIKVWGTKVNYTVFKGFLKVGKAVKLEPIFRYVPSEANENTAQELNYYNIAFRNFGFWSWIKAYLLGRWEHILVDPEAVNIDTNKKSLVINPKAFIVDDSGIWTLATRKDTGLIDEINIKAEYENSLGFQQDYLRRLSSHDPVTSKEANLMEHGAELEERSKQNRITRWVKG